MTNISSPILTVDIGREHNAPYPNASLDGHYRVQRIYTRRPIGWASECKMVSAMQSIEEFFFETLPEVYKAFPILKVKNEKDT